jgi:hypothetical protein
MEDEPQGQPQGEAQSQPKKSVADYSCQETLKMLLNLAAAGSQKCEQEYAQQGDIVNSLKGLFDEIAGSAKQGLDYLANVNQQQAPATAAPAPPQQPQQQPPQPPQQ